MKKKKSIHYIIRSHKKISAYKYKIYLKDQDPIIGTISREEMELIRQLYTEQGANFTLKELSNHFIRYSELDLLRILRLFNITKKSSLLTPHQLEELTSEEATNYVLGVKERLLNKKIQEIKHKKNEETIKKLLIEKEELTKSLESKSLFLKGIDYEKINKIPLFAFKNIESPKNNLVLYLSDMHIGAYVNHEGVYDNSYSRYELTRRLDKIYTHILDNMDNINSITVFNLGDALDGMNNKTTRIEHSHYLPQNMTNKEMCNTYIECVCEFFSKLSTITANLHFISVSESNHGGDLEYASTIALCSILNQKGIKTTLAKRSIDYIQTDFALFIYLHGKDTTDQFKPFPLTLNEKTENYFLDYLINYNLTGIKNTIIVKGDSHRSNLSKGKKFDYKSVSSLFGSSKWIHSNFGNTPWGCDYSLFNENNHRVDGIINDL